MARDIEEFLRRAAERRRQQQKGGQQQPQPRVREIIGQEAIEIIEPEIVQAEVVRPKLARQRRPMDRDSAPRGETVAGHVSSHIDSSDIAEHAEHLGDRIQSVDDKVAARINRKFNHDMGQLDDMPTVQDDVVATVTKEAVSHIAADLVRMLGSPKSVREAIMISEILKRPNFDE